MSNKFLTVGGDVNLSNGSTAIYAATLGAANLEPSQTIKTNATRQLISTDLAISDTSGLQAALDSKLGTPMPVDLDMGGNSITNANDVETKDYFSVNERLQTIDNFDASVGTTTSVNGLLNVDELATDRVYDATQSTFIEMDGIDVNVSAGDLTLNGNSVLTSADGDFVRLDDSNPQTMIGDLESTRFSTGLTTKVGPNAALNNPGAYSISIGSDAGKNNTRTHMIAIGTQAGFDSTSGDKQVAIGYSAGRIPMPSKTIALGSDAYPPGTPSTGTAGFYIGKACIRNVSAPSILYYEPSTGEITEDLLPPSGDVSSISTTSVANSIPRFSGTTGKVIQGQYTPGFEPTINTAGSLTIKNNIIGERSTSMAFIASTANSDDVFNSATFQMRRARGDISALSGILDGDHLGKFRFDGYNGTEYLNAAQVRCVANGNFSLTNRSTSIEFRNNLLNQNSNGGTPRLTITGDGNVELWGGLKLGNSALDMNNNDITAVNNLSTSGAVQMTSGSFQHAGSSFQVQGVGPVQIQNTGSCAITPQGSLTLSAHTNTGEVDMSNNRITNMAEPTNATDAATKQYVDSIPTGVGGAFFSSDINNYDVSGISSLFSASIQPTPIEIQTLKTGTVGQVIVIANLRTAGAGLGELLIRNDFTAVDADERPIRTFTNADYTLPTNTTGFLTYNSLFAGEWYFTLSGEAATDITNLETKTQNISLAGTTVDETVMVGSLSVGDVNGSSGLLNLQSSSGSLNGITINDNQDRVAVGAAGIITVTAPSIDIRGGSEVGFYSNSTTAGIDSGSSKVEIQQSTGRVFIESKDDIINQASDIISLFGVARGVVLTGPNENTIEVGVNEILISAANTQTRFIGTVIGDNTFQAPGFQLTNSNIPQAMMLEVDNNNKLCVDGVPLMDSAEQRITALESQIADLTARLDTLTSS